MTLLQAINSVLRRLREDEVTASNDTSYSKLIGEFINQAIYDVEHAWDWNCLKETVTITTAASDDTYDFHTADAKILYGINETKNWVMRVIPAAYQHHQTYLNSPLTGSPYYYSIQSKNSTSSQIILYPVPTAVESLRFLTIKHTPAYDLDSTDDANEIVCPSHPVVLNAYARAISERGEDGGISFNEADALANQALADAIGLDASNVHYDEVSWHVC